MDGQAEFVDAIRRGDADGLRRVLRDHPALARRAFEHEKTGLHLAAEADHPNVARVLLDAGADLEARTAWGATALEWAATLGSVRAADVLLERGAAGLTLLVAAGLGKLDVVRTAVEVGGSVPAVQPQPDDHWTRDAARVVGDALGDALQSAARNGQAHVAEFLLDRGANVDAKGVFGGTGLHWAALHGHAATVRLLVARGARRDLRDARFDGTPADWAHEGGHAELAAELGG